MPVHLRRLLKRGYNQSEALARGAIQGLIEAGIKARYEDLLQKTAHRKSQINFDPYHRWGNTKETFSAKKKRVPEDALIFIVDDTVTTGSTLVRAAEAVLQAYPNAEVHLLALAQEI